MSVRSMLKGQVCNWWQQMTSVVLDHPSFELQSYASAICIWHPSSFVWAHACLQNIDVKMFKQCCWQTVNHLTDTVAQRFHFLCP